MQLVVVMAVRKAVSAATITFTATSTILFVFITLHSFNVESLMALECHMGTGTNVLSIDGTVRACPLCVTSKA